MRNRLEGLVAAPLVGYHPDGSVNLDIVPRYAAMLHANGVAGAFVNGTTGEGMSLTVQERCSMAERWVDAAPEGLKIIIHVGHICQADSQAMAAHAQQIGAFAIGEVGPFFFRPSSVEALADYCAATAASAPRLPYYFYHIPSMTHVLFPMIEFLSAASSAIPNLAGVKYTYEDLDDYERCRMFEHEKYDILFGRDEFLIEGLKRGARGAVGSTYNAFAALYRQLIDAFHAGNMEDAAWLQSVSANTCRILNETREFRSGLKAVMRMIGLDLGGVRRPQINLSDDEVRQMEAALRRAGVLEYLNGCADVAAMGEGEFQ